MTLAMDLGYDQCLITGLDNLELFFDKNSYVSKLNEFGILLDTEELQ